MASVTGALDYASRTPTAPPSPGGAFLCAAEHRRRLINLNAKILSISRMGLWTRIQSIPEWVHHVAVVLALSVTGIVFW